LKKLFILLRLLEISIYSLHNCSYLCTLLKIVRAFSIDDVSGTSRGGSSSFSQSGIGMIMLDHPEGLLAGSLMLDSKIAGSGGRLDWNVRTQNEDFLVFVGLNVSDNHNMIKLVKVNDKYRGDLQLDSYIWKILRSIQQLLTNLVVKGQNKQQNYVGLGQQNNVGSIIPLIPLLGNVQVHIDGKLQVVSSSKW
jgi:hypothetical protein